MLRLRPKLFPVPDASLERVSSIGRSNDPACCDTWGGYTARTVARRRSTSGTFVGTSSTPTPIVVYTVLKRGGSCRGTLKRTVGHTVQQCTDVTTCEARCLMTMSAFDGFLHGCTWFVGDLEATNRRFQTVLPQGDHHRTPRSTVASCTICSRSELPEESTIAQSIQRYSFLPFLVERGDLPGEIINRISGHQ